MKICYLPLETVAVAVARQVEIAAGNDSKVRYCAATNAAQLWDMAMAQVSGPLIVVCLGKISYDNDEDSLSRSIEIIIAISDTYRHDLESKADSIWSIGERCAEKFYPDETTVYDESVCDDTGESLLEWRVDGITPGPGNDERSLLYVNLTVKEYAQDGDQM